MNTNDLNTALYEKMAAEQDKFRDWLKSQPPEEVLNHAYEYTIREDIVMAIEELELTDTQAQALLESSLPLADVYRYFEKLETGHMDVIRDSIENRADDVCRAKEELRTTPIYPHSAAYAREHGELEQYRASNNVNRQCKESIEAAVREHFDGMYLSHDAAKGVIETYGMERVSMVLSNTVQLQDWDGRYSRRNKEWAKTIPNDNPETDQMLTDIILKRFFISRKFSRHRIFRLMTGIITKHHISMLDRTIIGHQHRTIQRRNTAIIGSTANLNTS